MFSYILKELENILKLIKNQIDEYKIDGYLLVILEITV